MLLTIACEGPGAEDLSYLLHKSPFKVQRFPLAFGQAVVFYPEYSAERVCAALMLDVDPLALARDQRRALGLPDYVSDRPYSSSSFMSVALARVFGSALGGRCPQRPEAVGRLLDLTVEAAMLPCRRESDREVLTSIFAHLGCEAVLTPAEADSASAEWCGVPYFNLRVRARTTLTDLLKRLYVLLPVSDGRKHYYIGRDEVEKLLRHGEGWLTELPEREFVARRYLRRAAQLVKLALERLDDGQGGAEEEPQDEAGTPIEVSEKASLDKRRMAAILAALARSGASSVIDLGCGEGRLLSRLARAKEFQRVAGLDVSLKTLERAQKRLTRIFRRLPDKVTLLHGSVVYLDERLRGYDAAVCQEVVEHLEPHRLPVFAQILFGEMRPKTVAVTTPNREWNVKFANLPANGLRHADHRFEFSRAEFAQWAETTARRHGYRVELDELGELDDQLGRPTLMGIFAS
ncbi:MAG: 3' terminal RNA ribose 2'-O-methyltransferase Hen1 [Deltaproteobacteria bacterium]|jgi:3' terminal RNA ribose 2'-O-methyltransferase Hen1|nr:3' terminal RNA ribose 2'-O-methyltransferase Hen1 [Deltaproteobacteria bacterium]